MPEPKSPFKRVRRAFSQEDLKRVCEMHENLFAETYDMETWVIDGRDAPSDVYYFKDNGSKILAVAHLDTVVNHDQRTANFVDTEGGPVVHSGALDDRLGAYTLLELMPKLGIQFDWLLTTGEESGKSTAAFFQKPEGKEYHWMIEFDRGGTDVVMYQYEDLDLRRRVKDTGATVGVGIFSDISYMSFMEIKGMNWGVGYRDYHSVRGYAYLEDYWMMMGYFLKFHAANADEYLPHDNTKREYSSTVIGGRSGGSDYSYWGGGGGWGESDAYWESGGQFGKGDVDLDELTDDEIMADLDDMDEELIAAGMLDPDDVVSEDYATVKAAIDALSASTPPALEPPAPPSLEKPETNPFLKAMG